MCVRPLDRRLLSSRLVSALALLYAGGGVGCGDGGTGPQDTFADLAGTWRATLFRWTRVADPGAEPVDLIALGGALTLEIGADGSLRMTTREVGADQTDTVLGSGRLLEGGILELETGGPAPVALEYRLTGDLLRLTGRLTVRAGGVGPEEEVDLEAVLVRTGGAPTPSP